MEEKYQHVLQTVLGRVVPSYEEREATARTAEEVLKRVQTVLEEAGVQAVVEVGGSVAKDTWLRDDVEIDFFVLFSSNVDRETLRRTGLSVAYKAVEGHKSRERYAEHPYLEAWVNGTRVNIVPCYQVADKRWLSSADRSPYHTRYVRSKLEGNSGLANEVRLLKRFLKGVDVYGAEIRVGGFSGYLCELLTLGYGSFLSSLRAFAKWRFGQVLDIEELHQRRLEEVRRLFQAPLIVVDPVDMNRNVAAAVTKECMSELVAASRLFLERPAFAYFYPEKVSPDIHSLREKLSSSEFDAVAVVMSTEERVPDILWGELRKTTKAIANLLGANGFTVFRAEAWSDETGLSAILLVLESRNISSIRKHLGPPGDSETTAFLEKYRAEGIIGPWVEDGRWMVGAKRHYTDAVTLLSEKLAEGGHGVGVSDELVAALQGSRLLIGADVLNVSSSNGYMRFLGGLLANPRWLAYSSSSSSSSSS